MSVNLVIPSLGNKFQDYRDGIPGDSYSWGPLIRADQIDAFTFHHSVTVQTAKTDGNWKKECDVIANLHLGQGWGGVGYRFIICSDGTVAYVGDLGRGGSAVGDHNNHMFSACFIGDFTKQLATAIQIHSAFLLAKHFLTAMPAYPNLSSWDQIKGHQDYNPTTCPSPVWRSGQDSLRNRILQDNYSGYPNPQPAGTTPTPLPQPAPPTTDWQKKYNDLVAEFNTYKTTKQKKIDDAVVILKS